LNEKREEKKRRTFIYKQRTPKWILRYYVIDCSLKISMLPYLCVPSIATIDFTQSSALTRKFQSLSISVDRIRALTSMYSSKCASWDQRDQNEEYIIQLLTTGFAYVGCKAEHPFSLDSPWFQVVGCRVASGAAYSRLCNYHTHLTLMLSRYHSPNIKYGAW
jgi:hypothetical protein